MLQNMLQAAERLEHALQSGTPNEVLETRAALRRTGAEAKAWRTAFIPIVVVKCDGGVVQGTVTNIEGANVLVLDYDVKQDDRYPEGFPKYPESDGTDASRANAYWEPPLFDRDYTRMLLDITEAAECSSHVKGMANDDDAFLSAGPFNDDEQGGKSDSWFTATCPSCGGKDIAHVERALVTTRVETFRRNSRTSELEVAAYREATQIDYASTDTVDLPWNCLSCKREFVDDDLVLHGGDSPAVDASNTND